MSSVADLLAAGMAHHQVGRLREAESAYRLLLQIHPNHAQGWYLLGGLAYQLGNRDVAIQSLSRAADLSPVFRLDLGLLLFELGRLNEAADCLSRFLTTNPVSAEAYLALGQVQQKQGKLGEAAECFRRALEFNPNAAEALDCLGLVLQQQGNAVEALECHRRALSLDPTNAAAHFNIGTALRALGRLPEAIAAYHRAIDLNPSHAEAYCNLGNALQSEQKHDEAIACFRQAIGLQPNFAVAHYNLGNALRERGENEAAIAAYHEALRLWPHFAEAYNGLGAAYRERQLIDQAVECFQQAAKIRPDFADPQFNLATALRELGRPTEAVALFRRALERQPHFLRGHSNLLYSLLFCPGATSADIYAEHARWNDLYAKPLCSANLSHGNDRNPNRRLRIGYVSPDFRNHVLAHSTFPVLANHDHEQFAIICYSDVLVPDSISDRLRSLADVWRDIRSLNDDQLAKLIRHDQIDILVDSTMHMDRNRLLVFARKPAPVQVTWLAYPGTTGLTSIDYRLTDPWLDPPNVGARLDAEKWYSESCVWLPDTFWCYDPLTSQPDVNSLPAFTNGYITFGNLNVFAKFNHPMLQLWSQVLKIVPQSRLLLLAPESSCRQWAAKIFQAEGIDPDRIEFVGRQPREKYLELYHHIDICLDTIPYNGHTTSLDALWMGVPTITRVGDTVVGRAGLSQLNNLGLSEFVAHNDEEFVQIAAKITADIDRLQALRGKLREQMQRSPLMDAPRFVCNLEAAYRKMWTRWCDRTSNPPIS